MVVKNAVTNKQSVGLLVNPAQLRRKRFGASVRAGRPHRCLLVLRRFNRIPENFRGRRMIKSHRAILVARDLEQSKRRHTGFVAGGLRNIEAQTDVTLAGQMIDLGRLHLPKNSPQRRRVRQIAIMKKEGRVVNLRIVSQMLDARSLQIARPADNPMDRVAFFQEQFGQIRSVLPGNAGDQRDLSISHGSQLSMKDAKAKRRGTLSC